MEVSDNLELPVELREEEIGATVVESSRSSNEQFEVFVHVVFIIFILCCYLHARWVSVPIVKVGARCCIFQLFKCV
eukprot:snap_masked-scaffold_71-processed-gene-0.30-mRNA-1 protein AED:1.00 eAED:1.00 QI:0/0/0/0/1/1/3/0/75